MSGNPLSALVESVKGPAAVPPPPPAVQVSIAPLRVPEALPAYERGDFIGDLFQVIQTLGEGGFGIVYLARSLASNDIVALKTLRGELLRDAKTRALFEKEARIWMDLGAHPNLVRAKWVDEVSGRLYIAMEYVQSGAGRPNSLEGHLEKGPIELEKALLWAIQFCRGMEYAMSKGIRCHRDIKPANILIGGDNVVKISDFGIAGLALVPEAPRDGGGRESASPRAAEDDPTKTVVGTVFGTPTHMAPEQFVDAASCDERSDVYSFGVVLYQIASGGRLPFRPAPPPAALAAQAGAYYWHAFRTLHTTANEAPLNSPLAPMVARCLKKRREERYSGFAALRADLEALYESTRGEKAPLQAGRVESANDWVSKGISFGTLNRWSEALECYDKAAALEPQAAAIQNNRGSALRHLNRPDEALAALDRAIALDPLFAPAWENKALLYAHAQRNEEALACIERSLTLDPTRADAWVIKGVMFGRLNRIADEVKAYEDALRIDPRNASAWFNKANTISTTDPGTALQCLDQALASDPTHVSAWSLKGMVLGELGRTSEGVVCLQEAVRLDPRDGGISYNLGNAWAALGQLDAARSAYDQATRLAPDVPVFWYNFALVTFRMGLHPQAVSLFDHFLSFDPPHDGLRRTAERLTSELRAGRVPELGPINVGARITPEEKATIDAQALKDLQDVGPAPAAVTPTPAPSPPPPPQPLPEEPLPGPLPNADDLNRQATAHFNAGRYLEALAVVDVILKLDPREEFALNTLASTLFRMGRKDEACDAIDRAIEASPGDLPIWNNKLLMESGASRPQASYRTAIDIIEIAQAGGTKSPAVDTARKMIDTLQSKGVSPNPRSHLGWLGLAYVSMVAKRRDAALDFLDKAMSAAPGNVEVLRWKASALKELKRADDALAIYDRALAMAPRDAEVHHDRGVVLAMLREFGKAVEAFDSALAIDPNHVASLSDKGKYAGEMGRHDVALQALRRAAALRPDHPAPWLNKALVEDTLNRDEDALESHLKFLERAKPEMRLQIESSKRRVEQLRARVAARKGVPALRPVAKAPAPSPSSVPGQPMAATPIDDPFLKSIAGFLSEDGDDMSDEELARLAKAMDGDDADTLLKMLRAVGQPGSAPPSSAPLRVPAAAPPPAPPPAPPAPAAKASGNPVAKKWAEQGRAHLAAGKPVEALAAFDKAIERDVNEARYWSERGDALKALSRHDQAVEAWSKAVLLNAGCVPALLGLAADRKNKGDYAEAIKILLHASGVETENAVAWHELGDAYRHGDDWEHAYAAFGLSLKARPKNALSLAGLGEAALNLGRVADAIVALDEAVVIDPNLAPAWFLRGAAQAQLGLIAEAAESQRRAVELNPGSANAWYNLAHNLHSLKRPGDALLAANRALQIRPDFALALNTKGLALMGLRRHEEALDAFTQSLAAKAGSPVVLTNKGNALVALKRMNEAFAAFNEALLLKPDHQSAIAGRAGVLAALQAEVEGAMEKRLEASAGLSLPEAEIPNTAPQASLDECLKRSEMARNQAYFDRALEWADQAIVADPRKFHTWLAKAEALFGLRRYAEAAAHAKKAAAINPKFGPVWARLASSYDALDAPELALAAWDKAIETAGQNVLNWCGRGNCLARMGRLEEALEAHDRSLSIDPRFSLGKYHKGRLEAELGRREEAIRSLQQFLALAPPNLAALAQEARKRIQELKA